MELKSVDLPALQWVMKARATEPGRYAIGGVYLDVESDEVAYLVATDGQRLHVAKLKGQYTSTDQGLYTVAKSGSGKQARYVFATHEGLFPKWRSVIPDMSDQPVMSAKAGENASVVGYGIHHYIGAAVNVDYLQDAMTIPGSKTIQIWDIQGNDPAKQILMTCGDLRAVIMPIKPPIEFVYTKNGKAVKPTPEYVTVADEDMCSLELL